MQTTEVYVYDDTGQSTQIHPNDNPMFLNKQKEKALYMVWLGHSIKNELSAMVKSILFKRNAALRVTNNALCLMSGLVSGIWVGTYCST